MKKIRKYSTLENTTICALLIVMLMLLTGCRVAELPDDIDKVTAETAEVILAETPVILSGSIGGEFALKGLVESGTEIDSELIEDYYTNLSQTVKAKKGILSERRYTEYARASIGLLAIGKDPQNVEGYDLIEQLDNYKGVNNQGINAESYAVLVARMAGVKLANEDKYVDNIISDIKRVHKEKPEKYSDYVAIELLGLSLVDGRDKEISEAVQLAEEYLSECQRDDGSMGNSDSTSIAIIGLIQTGTDIFKDERFIKNGNTLADGLMKYELKDGGFGYMDAEEYNQMSTESALLALDAIKKSTDGHRLYE